MTRTYCEIDWRPILQYQGRPCEFMAKAWDGDHNKTIAALQEELQRNDIDSVVIETSHNRSEYTAGGRPRAGINPNQPHVQLCFTLNGKPVCIPSAKYGDWMQNLKAIQMTLRARRLEREKYGCATIEQQYEGHTQLPGGDGSGSSSLSSPPTNPTNPTTAARLLITLSGATGIGERDILENQDTFHETYKTARTKAHPDKGTANSSDEMFASVQRARQIILDHKGW